MEAHKKYIHCPAGYIYKGHVCTQFSISSVPLGYDEAVEQCGASGQRGDVVYYPLGDKMQNEAFRVSMMKQVN